MVKPTYPLLAMVSALVFANGFEYVTQSLFSKRQLKLIQNYNCRNRMYPSNHIDRFEVPDDKVSWNVEWDQYAPPMFTSSKMEKFSDVDTGCPGVDFFPKWNDYDDKINRISVCGNYSVVNSFPLNPTGRTGLSGRGMLPRYGPNPWVHLLITRFRRDFANRIVIAPFTGKPILELIAIRNSDKGLWAVPGRRVLVGESLQTTVRRVYYTGIGSIYNLHKRPSEEEIIKDRINKSLDQGNILYQGYVDDHRNTDNAWVETTVVHYHDLMGDVVGNMTLYNSDNIIVEWVKVSTNLRWIPRHFCFVGSLVKVLLKTDLYGTAKLNNHTRWFI